MSDKLHEELTKSFIDKRISILSRSLKQDISLGTKITTESEVIIDGQFIGKLEGLKLNLDFKSGSLDTDLKSLRKAARQAIAPELMRRVTKILRSEVLKLDSDRKIYWKDNPIAYLSSGKDYLNPRMDLIVDQAIDMVVRAAGLSYEIQGTSILIADASRLNTDVGVTSHIISLNMDGIQPSLHQFK